MRASGVILKYTLNVNNLSKDNLTSLTEAICETNDARYIYTFAKDVNNLSQDNITSLANYICNSGDAYYIFAFLKLISRHYIDFINDMGIRFKIFSLFELTLKLNN